MQLVPKWWSICIADRDRLVVRGGLRSKPGSEFGVKLDSEAPGGVGDDGIVFWLKVESNKTVDSMISTPGHLGGDKGNTEESAVARSNYRHVSVFP